MIEWKYLIWFIDDHMILFRKENQIWQSFASIDNCLKYLLNKRGKYLFVWMYVSNNSVTMLILPDLSDWLSFIVRIAKISKTTSESCMILFARHEEWFIITGSGVFIKIQLIDFYDSFRKLHIWWMISVSKAIFRCKYHATKK